MATKYPTVARIDGDYAWLKRTEEDDRRFEESFGNRFMSQSSEYI